MKYINPGFLLAAIVLTVVGLYFWLMKGQIDRGALCLALAAMAHSVYLHSTKSDKAG